MLYKTATLSPLCLKKAVRFSTNLVLIINTVIGIDSMYSRFVRDSASIRDVICPSSGLFYKHYKMFVSLFKMNDRTEVGNYLLVSTSILTIHSNIFERGCL